MDQSGLPSQAAARLELLDVNGRRLSAREVGALGPGSHVLRIDDGRSLPPGLYLVRLVQGASTVTAKVVSLAASR